GPSRSSPFPRRRLATSRIRASPCGWSIAATRRWRSRRALLAWTSILGQTSSPPTRLLAWQQRRQFPARVAPAPERQAGQSVRGGGRERIDEPIVQAGGLVPGPLQREADLRATLAPVSVREREQLNGPPQPALQGVP